MLTEPREQRDVSPCTSAVENLHKNVSFWRLIALLASFVVIHIDIADGPGKHEAGSFCLGDLEQPFDHLSLHHRYVVIPALLLGELVSL